MPAIVRAAQTTNSGSSTATSFTPAKPAAAVSGDQLIVVVASSTAAAPTKPGTFTAVSAQADTTVRLDVMSGDGALTNAAWTKTTACKWAAVVVAIQAGTFDTGTLFDFTPVILNHTAAAATLYTTPSGTVLSDDCLLLAGFCNLAASTWTVPAQTPAMLAVASTAASATGACSVHVQSSGTNAVPTGAVTRQATASVSSADAVMWLAAIRPASTTPAVTNRWARGLPPGNRYSRPAVHGSTY